MLFNSFQFVAFFVVVYGLYIVLTHRYQNALLLVASYFFYGSWDWRFLALMLFSTTMDYSFGLALQRVEDARRRKLILITSVAVNLGFLFVFKYFNFFALNLHGVLKLVGLDIDVHLLNVVLPLGISFYTFHNISYIVDVYAGRVKAARNFIDFALYVALFPQLIAGPIARPSHLLPQIQKPRTIDLDMLRTGGWLILLGYFKKVVLADNMEPFTRALFQNPETMHGTAVLVGVYAFAFQIYGDFSGYSDIARGLARLMGFELALNFRHPYFAMNPADFWRRWHISLSTWLRDYLYIPLGGNREGTGKTYRNLCLTMFLGGLWHGAAWHYIAWGVFHGGLLCAHRAAAPLLARLEPAAAFSRRIWNGAKVATFFHVTCFGWLLFAAKSLQDVPLLLRNLAQPVVHNSAAAALTIVLFAGPLLLMEAAEERSGVSSPIVKSWPRFARATCYASVVAAIVLCGAAERHAFIYFQF